MSNSKPYTYYARLLRIVDADTYELAIDLGFHITTRQRVRLAAVDCPERNTPQGIATTIAAERWFALAKSPLTVEVIHYDRYGRIVAIITSPNTTPSTLAAYMLSHGCKKWTGRT